MEQLKEKLQLLLTPSFRTCMEGFKHAAILQHGTVEQVAYHLVMLKEFVSESSKEYVTWSEKFILTNEQKSMQSLPAPVDVLFTRKQMRILCRLSQDYRLGSHTDISDDEESVNSEEAEKYNFFFQKDYQKVSLVDNLEENSLWCLDHFTGQTSMLGVIWCSAQIAEYGRLVPQLISWQTRCWELLSQLCRFYRNKPSEYRVAGLLYSFNSKMDDLLVHDGLEPEEDEAYEEDDEKDEYELEK